MHVRRVRIATGLAAAGLAALAAAPAHATSAPPTGQVTQKAADSTENETDTEAPKGYLVDDLPTLDEAIDTTPPGSVIIRPGAKTVKMGKYIKLGLVIHFKDGGKVKYGVQEYFKGKWYDMSTSTKTDPADDCAMGGPGWIATTPAPGTVKIRGFSRQDGNTVVTPAYKVTITEK